VADIEWHAQEAGLTGRRKGNTRVQIGGHCRPDTGPRRRVIGL